MFIGPVTASRCCALASLLSSLVLLIGCGDGAGEASDQRSPPEVEAIPDFNGCTPSAYEDQRAANAARVIGVATTGLTFTPRCLLIRMGQTVTWQGALTAHPLAAGNPDDPSAGSEGSPILTTSSGDSVSFTFASAGTFPYQCQLHAFGAGKGMAGVVAVTE